MSSPHDLYSIFPELFILINVLIMLIVGAFQKKPSDYQSQPMGWAYVVVCMGAFLLVLLSGEQKTAFHGMFVVNSFTVYIKALILLSAAFLGIFALTTLEKKVFNTFEFPVLLLFSVLGMLVMISAHDFLLVFMGLELQAIPLYVLVSFRKDYVRTTEAGLKYFVLGALSTGFFLFGTSFLYGLTGTTNFQGMENLLGQSLSLSLSGVGLSLAFILGALGFKSSLAPFHMWTPDIYEGTTSSVAGFLAICAKIAALGLIISLLYGPFILLISYWQPALISLAVLSMLFGAFGALTQKNLKRLIAYSTISHMGYMMAALSTGTKTGLQSVLVYITLYGLMTLGFFTCVMLLKKGESSQSLKLEDLSGLSLRHRSLAAFLAILMFSLAGIPPLGGFFSKFYLFLALIEKQMMVVAVIGVLSSVISCFYYLRIIKIMYFDAPKDQDNKTSVSYLSFHHFLLYVCVGGGTVFFFFILPWLLRIIPQGV